MSSPCSGNSPKGDGALCDLPEACKRIGKYEARFRSAGAELARRYTPHVHFAESDSDMEDFARECASAAIVAGSELGVAWAGPHWDAAPDVLGLELAEPESFVRVI